VSVGVAEGCRLGKTDGSDDMDGAEDGIADGIEEGEKLGIDDAEGLNDSDGCSEGCGEGGELGLAERDGRSDAEGRPEGAMDGQGEGADNLDGRKLGLKEVIAVDNGVGAIDGMSEKAGVTAGAADAWRVGALVGPLVDVCPTQ